MMPEQTRLEILQKLMALHAWDTQRRPSGQPRLVDLLLQQWESPAGCKPLEDALKKDPLDEIGPDDVDERLYRRLYASAPLRRQLVDGPLFSEADQTTFRILVQLADITPNREQTMMDSGDTLFQRVLERWRQEPVTPEQLLQQDLARLIELDREAPTVIPALAELAAEERWPQQMQAVESRLENPNAKMELSPAAEKVWQAVKAVGGANGRNSAADILLSHPRFSTSLPLLVRLFADLDPAAIHDGRLLEQIRDERPDEMEVVTQEVQYRLEVAQYFLALRKFAKLDALAYQWPDLYQRFNVQRSAVVEFEQYVNEPEATRDEPKTLSQTALRLWGAYVEDEALMRFLHLRPLLAEIYKAERERYQQVQAQTATVQQVRTERPELEALPNEKSIILSSSLPDLAADVAPEPVLLHIRPTEGEADSFDLLVKCGDISEPGHASIDWWSLEERETKLLVHADPNSETEKRFRELGRWLFFQLFKGSTERALRQALSQGSSTALQRVSIQADAPKLHYLPWESLYVPPPIDRLIGASSHFSMLRYVPGSAEKVHPERGVPLRVLVIIQDPADALPVDVSYERSLVERTMGDASRFQVTYLEDISMDAFQKVIQNEYPHVVHFVRPPAHERATELIFTFVDGENRTNFLTAETVAAVLKQGQVKMVTLAQAGTPTRMMVADEPTINAAVGLAAGGIPAVVVPTRTGLFSVPFHYALYQALAGGQSVEAAVLAGRRVLKTENQPWIRYALFAGVREPVQLIA